LLLLLLTFQQGGGPGKKKRVGARGDGYTKVLLFSIVWIDCEFWRKKKIIKNNTGVQVQQKQEEKQKQKHKQQQHQVQNRAKQ
jgi:amino acid permease